MHTIKNARRRALFAASLIFTVFASMAIPATVVTSPASAAGTAALTVDVQALNPTVAAGNTATWQVSYQCASVSVDCTGATLTVPIPTSSPDGVQAFYVGATSPAPATGVSVVGNNIVWTLQDPLPAGQTAQVTFTLRTQNLVTPNGDTYTPVATITATNAPTATSTANAAATTTVTAASPHTVTKTRVGDPNVEPNLNTNVVYQVAWKPSLLSSTGTWSAGAQYADNVVLTDTIPAGAVFVSATGGGVYSGPNPSDGTGVITWPAQNESQGATGATEYVVLNYPSPPFTADNSKTNTSDNVTNIADLTAEPYLRPNDPPITAHAQVSHGFNDQVSTSSTVAKTTGIDKPRNQTVQRGATWRYATAVANTGTTPMDFSVDDNMPCMFTSPTTRTTTCTVANLAVWGSSFNVTTSTVNDRFVDYTLTDGTTGTITIPGGTTGSFAIPGVSPTVALAYFTMRGHLEVGEVSNIEVSGNLNPAVPNDAPAGTPYLDGSTNPVSPPDVGIENCVGQTPGSATFTANGVTTDYAFDPTKDCATNIAPPASPAVYPSKSATGSVQAPGGAIRFRLSAANGGGTAPWHPVIIDPIPANLTYVPGSASVTTVPNSTYPWAAQAIVEYIPNYNGTGQAVLRISWPSTFVVNPTDGTLAVSFNAVVKPGSAPGGYTNKAYWMDSVSDGSICAPAANSQADTNDYDGDGLTTDTTCTASTPYTVAQGAGATVSKQVEGSLDSSFQSTPAVGRTVSGASSTFRSS